MKRDYHPYIIHGCLFMYLMFNFFTKENNEYRNIIISMFMCMYTVLATLYHLSKNDKL